LVRVLHGSFTQMSAYIGHASRQNAYQVVLVLIAPARELVPRLRAERGCSAKRQGIAWRYGWLRRQRPVGFEIHMMHAAALLTGIDCAIGTLYRARLLNRHAAPRSRG
jgi:hypothetical protein